MVRAIAASEARREPPRKREPLLVGLDRLRALEDSRAASLHRLLEAGSLLRRVVDLGLEDQDPDRAAHAYMALAALGGSGSE